MLAKQTKPPARFTEASLLGAMETAGKLVDDEELREAMKESGLGTPATRADTIERLLNVGYIEREAKALVSTPKGRQTIELLGSHALTSAELTGSWEKRLSAIEHGQDERPRFMGDIAQFAEQIVDYFRNLREASLGTCPNCDGEIRENRAAFGCSSYKSKKEPGCGFTIWKSQQGYTIGRDDVERLLREGEAPLHGPRPAKLVLGEGNLPQLVGEDGTPITEALKLAPCPNGDGEIRENRAAFGCTSYKSKDDPGCGFTIWKSQAGFTITADDVRRLLETGEAALEGPQPAKLILADGNRPQIVAPDGTPLGGTLGPCPNGDGEIRENRRGFGCSSWKSKSEPGCGFTIWKSQKGFTITAADVRRLLEQREAPLEGPVPAKLVLGDDNLPQLVDDSGAPLGRAARVTREPIATCPRCGGEIRENSRAFGCSSWKSKKNPGCGFVIWKSTKGREITPDEARTVIETGRVGPLSSATARASSRATSCSPARRRSRCSAPTTGQPKPPPDGVPHPVPLGPCDVPRVRGVVVELSHGDVAEAGVVEHRPCGLLAPHRAQPVAALGQRHGHAVQARDGVEERPQRVLQVLVHVRRAGDVLHQVHAAGL